MIKVELNPRKPNPIRQSVSNLRFLYTEGDHLGSGEKYDDYAAFIDPDRDVYGARITYDGTKDGFSIVPLKIVGWWDVEVWNEDRSEFFGTLQQIVQDNPKLLVNAVIEDEKIVDWPSYKCVNPTREEVWTICWSEFMYEFIPNFFHRKELFSANQ